MQISAVNDKTKCEKQKEMLERVISGLYEVTESNHGLTISYKPKQDYIDQILNGFYNKNSLVANILIKTRLNEIETSYTSKYKGYNISKVCPKIDFYDNDELMCAGVSFRILI